MLEQQEKEMILSHNQGISAATAMDATDYTEVVGAKESNLEGQAAGTPSHDYNGNGLKGSVISTPSTSTSTPGSSGKKPSYLEMVVTVIRELRDRNGSSLPAIRKVIASKFFNGDMAAINRSMLNKTLRNGLSEEKLMRLPGRTSYKLHAEYKKKLQNKEARAKKRATQSKKAGTAVKVKSASAAKNSPKVAVKTKEQVKGKAKELSKAKKSVKEAQVKKKLEREARENVERKRT